MKHLHLPETFETERLWIHRLRYEDAEEIFYAYASKSDATRFVSWPTHQSIDDTRAYLRYAIPSWKLGKDYSFLMRLKSNNKLVGSIGALNDYGTVQFGYILSPTYWGRGFATESCRAFIKILVQLPLKRLHTFVDCENVPSIRVLQKSGMKEDIKLEKWIRFVNQESYKDCLSFYYPLNHNPRD